MIEDAIHKLDEDPKIRAYVLAQAAESQRRSSAYPQGLHSDGNKWRIGSLCLWKSEAFKAHCLSNDPFPYFDRGGIRESVFPDMRFDAEPFETTDGHQAIAIILRAEKDPLGAFGTFSLDENEASRIISLLNREMDATRTIALERYRAAGGDPVAVASQRAPSRAERSAALDLLFGDPDQG